MQTFLGQQCERNIKTKHLWDSMSEHRREVSRAIARLARKDATIAVFGAGNCNDLDLLRLSTCFLQVNLFDLDRDAMSRAVALQAPRVDNIMIHAAELSGMARHFDETDSPVSAEERVSQAHSARPLPESNLFDVVISDCMLSQLLGFVSDRFSSPDLLLAIRDAHLELMLRHTRPGGRAVLLCDMVSSSTLPQLGRVTDSTLEALRDHAIRKGNFFHGTNPHAIVRYFASSPSVARVQLMRPWRWNIGKRSFLVNAIQVDQKQRSS